MSMSKRAFERWLDSQPEDEREPDHPHQDDPTEEELRAMLHAAPELPSPTDAELDEWMKRCESCDPFAG
jgi:hypothetical protein